MNNEEYSTYWYGQLVHVFTSTRKGQKDDKLKFRTEGLLQAAKADSTLAGAATGAAFGSFFPSIGTFFGSAVGGEVGFAIGVSVDNLMLIVEEELGREDFHRDILRSINEQEAAMISLLSTQS